MNGAKNKSMDKYANNRHTPVYAQNILTELNGLIEPSANASRSVADVSVIATLRNIESGTRDEKYQQHTNKSIQLAFTLELIQGARNAKLEQCAPA